MPLLSTSTRFTYKRIDKRTQEVTAIIRYDDSSAPSVHYTAKIGLLRKRIEAPHAGGWDLQPVGHDPWVGAFETRDKAAAYALGVLLTHNGNGFTED